MHTPGPWKAGDTDEFGDVTILPESGGLAVAAVPNGEFMRIRGKTGEHHANAQLIAAAPELLDALKQAKGWLENWASAEPQIAVIDAAISKAEGLTGK
ncbi:MAG: hypothetical protein KDJ90_06605 [Nitratireductor sp.]|nr:hypothetical protein [Nitratireductor sp.]